MLSGSTFANVPSRLTLEVYEDYRSVSDRGIGLHLSGWTKAEENLYFKDDELIMIKEAISLENKETLHGQQFNEIMVFATLKPSTLSELNTRLLLGGRFTYKGYPYEP